MRVYYYFLAMKCHFILILLWLLTSCSQEKGQLYEVGSVSFHTGFPTGKFEHYEFAGKEYLAFSDFVTSKQIILFNMNAKRQNTIDVKELMVENGVRFIDFFYYNLDSIFLLGKYNNKIYLIDESGSLIDVFDYTRLFKKNVALSPPLNVKGNKLMVGLNYIPFDDRPANYGKEEMITENLNRLSSPKLLIDSNIFDSAERHSFQFNSFHSRFTRNDQWAIEGTPIEMFAPVAILASSYSDSIYIYDQRYNLAEVIKVWSEYAQLTLKPQTFKAILKDQSVINANFLGHGFINRIYYDSYRELYYCFIRHMAIDEHRPFSIIVYSKEFERLDEFQIDEKKFYNNGFVAKMGLYLKNNNAMNAKENSFTIFDYAKN